MEKFIDNVQQRNALSSIKTIELFSKNVTNNKHKGMLILKKNLDYQRNKDKAVQNTTIIKGERVISN